jgi:hypothetical protein
MCLFVSLWWVGGIGWHQIRIIHSEHGVCEKHKDVLVDNL